MDIKFPCCIIPHECMKKLSAPQQKLAVTVIVFLSTLLNVPGTVFLEFVFVWQGQPSGPTKCSQSCCRTHGLVNVLGIKRAMA